ncbi:MAG: hypothetical protein J5607_04800 [Clostridiales bacterium]|nr:hypothetical protein [Clostridiales bacterium]
MGDIIDQINTYKEMADPVLNVARSMGVPVDKWISVPLTQLTSLGNGVSSLLTEFNNVTQNVAESKQAIYQLANADVGDTLEMVKNGKFWDAFKDSAGGPKVSQLKKMDPASGASSMVMKANPATMMMAVALFSIEKELGDIEEMQKQILSFLEAEKQSEIKTDVEAVTKIITDYKENWDDERFINTRLNTLDAIRLRARKNMHFYHDQVSEDLKAKKLIVMGSKVNSTLTEMQKQFKYYRLSLYSYSLSSLADILLRGNFKESNINSAISEISKATEDYSTLYGECSTYLEKMSNGSVQTNLLKGAGAASNAMGKLIGNIPKVKDKPANDFLIKKGEKFKDSAQKGSLEVVESFAEMSNPNTEGVLKQLEDMNQIYNKTTGICFDKDNLYLVTE